MKTLIFSLLDKLSYEHDSSSPQSSSRNLENPEPNGFDFLNIQDPERYWVQSFPGSRILRNPNPQLTLRERISKFRDDEVGLAVRFT